MKTKALSFLLSAVLMLTLICVIWVVGVVGQRPQIPAQTPEVSYVEIILHSKRHNPIDDHYPTLGHPLH